MDNLGYYIFLLLTIIVGVAVLKMTVKCFVKVVLFLVFLFILGCAYFLFWT